MGGLDIRTHFKDRFIERYLGIVDGVWPEWVVDTDELKSYLMTLLPDHQIEYMNRNKYLKYSDNHPFYPGQYRSIYVHLKSQHMLVIKGNRLINLFYRKDHPKYKYKKSAWPVYSLCVKFTCKQKE